MTHTLTGRRLLRSLIVVGALSVAALAGCSDDEGNGVGPGNGGSLQISVESIILNPKSPAPGDTLLATAVVTSDSTVPGDFATYAWSGTGGQFLETDRSTVRWIAPDTSTMFTIRVTATNSGGSSTGSRNVFVSRVVPVVASGAGPMFRSPSGDLIWYLSSDRLPSSSQFGGFGVSAIDVPSGSSSQSITSSGQTAYYFSRDVSMCAYEVPGATGGLRTIQYETLGMAGAVAIPFRPFFQRGPQYTEPYFAPDNSFLTYQIFLPDLILPPAQGGVDTFVVAIWDVATQTQEKVALQGGTQNFHPTISTDGAHLVYVSDRSGTQQWELYALPIVGGTVTPDTASAPIQLTDTGGLMGSANPVPANSPKAWNPVDPLLATLDADNKLRLVPTDGSGSILVNVAGNAREFVWSPNGQSLLMTTGSRIYRVDKTGGAVEIHQVESGDNATRLSWSSDEQFLLYAIKRLNATWYELIDLGGSLGIIDPLRVTRSGAVGEEGQYSTFAPIRAVWLPGAPVAYMLFFDAGATPKISKMDFSGLSP